MTTTTPGTDAALRLITDAAEWLADHHHEAAAEHANDWQMRLLLDRATGQRAHFGPAVTR